MLSEEKNLGSPEPEFAQRLKAWRKAHGYKSEEAAKVLGVTRTYYSKLENGRGTPSNVLVKALVLLEHKPVLSKHTAPPQESARITEDAPVSPREALKRARHAAGLSFAELAKRVQVEVGVLQALEDGRGKLSVRLAQKLEEALPGLSADELLAGSDEPPMLDEGGTTGTAGGTPNVILPPGQRGRLVPRLSMAQAGAYNIAHTDEGYTSGGVLTTLVDRKAFAVEIDGDSMSPKYNPGDLVICSPSSSPVLGKPVVVQTIHGEAFCKILLRETRTEIVLGSLNEQHKSFPIPRDEVAWIYPVKQAVVTP